jgi:hypothetical protein
MGEGPEEVRLMERALALLAGLGADAKSGVGWDYYAQHRVDEEA